MPCGYKFVHETPIKTQSACLPIMNNTIRFAAGHNRYTLCIILMKLSEWSVIGSLLAYPYGARLCEIIYRRAFKTAFMNGEHDSVDMLGRPVRWFFSLKTIFRIFCFDVISNRLVIQFTLLNKTFLAARHERSEYSRNMYADTYRPHVAIVTTSSELCFRNVLISFCCSQKMLTCEYCKIFVLEHLFGK